MRREGKGSRKVALQHANICIVMSKSLKTQTLAVGLYAPRQLTVEGLAEPRWYRQHYPDISFTSSELISLEEEIRRAEEPKRSLLTQCKKFPGLGFPNWAKLNLSQQRCWTPALTVPILDDTIGLCSLDHCWPQLDTQLISDYAMNLLWNMTTLFFLYTSLGSDICRLYHCFRNWMRIAHPVHIPELDSEKGQSSG